MRATKRGSDSSRSCSISSRRRSSSRLSMRCAYPGPGCPNRGQVTPACRLLEAMVPAKGDAMTEPNRRLAEDDGIPAVADDESMAEDSGVRRPFSDDEVALPVGESDASRRWGT